MTSMNNPLISLDYQTDLPIHNAILSDSLKGLQDLEFGQFPDVDCQNKQGDTAIHYLLKERVALHLDKINFLIKKGANLDILNDDGESPLHIATRVSDQGATEMLLKHGANVNIRNSKNSMTPLHNACSINNYTTTRMLLEAGAVQEKIGFFRIGPGNLTNRQDIRDLLKYYRNLPKKPMITNPRKGWFLNI